jgi:sulfur relay (sulfurtransferase) DsrF/TusC family protein
MSKHILQIVDTAYRATLEEQDDPVLWLATSLKGNGISLDVLLRGNAVNYLVRDQDATGLQFGGRRQTQPPSLARDVQRLIEKGASVYYLEDDLEKRGIRQGEIIDGPRPIAEAALPELLTTYQQVWSW